VDDVTGPAIPPPAAGLTFAHLGATVADLTVAMADFARLGVRSWEVRELGDTWAFDFSVMRTVHQRNTLANGTIPGFGAIELVMPDFALPLGPQLRLHAARPGLNHIAYRCTDLAGAGRELLDAGARLFMFSRPDDDEAHWLEVLGARGERGVLAELSNCYVQLASGSIVELLPAGRSGL
jgi:hypothetical protein